MNYELAKKLEEAKFPTIELTDHEDCNYQQVEFIDGVSYHIPDLAELIEACGVDFGKLENMTGGLWIAESQELMDIKVGYQGAGKTPEEAVAKLWLLLNKKV